MSEKRFHLLFTLILCMIAAILFPVHSGAQILSIRDQEQFTDSLKQDMAHAPYFGLYKDNYFTVGMPIGEKITAANSNVKFQLSISQRLTNARMPWRSYIFLMFTQKTIWNVFQESLPMLDMNFNPGLGWSIPYFNKGRYWGKGTLLIEHESNGRDGDASRSWNRISFIGNAMINDWLTVNCKYWIPIIDGGNNKDILYYAGIFQWGASVNTPDKKFGWNLQLTKRKGWNLNFNTVFEFNWRIHEKSNQYLFLQYYNGYGEYLLDYNKFQSALRVGIVIKPKFFSDY